MPKDLHVNERSVLGVGIIAPEDQKARRGVEGGGDLTDLQVVQGLLQLDRLLAK